MPDPIDFAAQGRLLATATPGPWWTDGLSMGLRHLRRNWEPYGEECPDGFDLPVERDAIWLTDLRNTIDAYREVVVAAQAKRDFERKWAASVLALPRDQGTDVTMAHVEEWRQKSVPVDAAMDAALARFRNVGEVRP